MAIVVAAILVALSCWTAWRLPPLHPAQLWMFPWALATTLFAIRLLPYRPMNLSTALLILGVACMFLLGSLVGDKAIDGRLASGSRSPRHLPSPVPFAAAIALAALALTLAAFIVQLIRDFGLRAALISSGNVRLAIGAGATPVTIKYVYIAFAAVALSTVAAAREPCRRVAYRWLAAATAAGFSMYFATGRSNIILALFIGLMIWGVAHRQSTTRIRIAIVLSTVAVIGLLVFTVGGAIIGKTFSSNEASTVDSVFTRHSDLAVLAVPYEYLSAPIAGLQREVALSTTWGAGHGCATLAFVCQIMRRAGLNVNPEPAIRASTKPPLAWNTYTSLDFFLIDGGLVLITPLAFLFGAFMGALWAGALRGRPSLIVLYAIFGSTLLYSAYQNSFFAPHVVGAAIISMSALGAGRWLTGRQGEVVNPGVASAI